MMSAAEDANDYYCMNRTDKKDKRGPRYISSYDTRYNNFQREELFFL
jgi:hypothetical protein